ncbi:MAG TPA: serine hydrolase domain-containing protein [Gaiellaceae bacterium]|nr:serine hydrolase domain-containing protein [Gaiellaceae bacterium]
MDPAGELDSALSQLASIGRFRGAVRVDAGGSVLLDRAYGEDGAGVTLTTDTAFQVASVSKSFTAACVVRQIEQDRLSLDDRLVSFVEDAPPTWREIRIRHLLTHTSGLAHWQDLPGHDLYTPVPREELIARFAATPLRFPTGRGWGYSSPGYVLLAHIVETVAGDPYPSILDSEVLQPLGLRQTRAAEPAPGVVAAHGSRAGEPAPSFDLFANAGTGDVWSTTADLARWPRALASLSPAVFTPRASVAREQDGLTDVGYGYGWFSATLGNERLVFHPGDNAGFVSLLVWAPERDLVVVVLAADEIDLQPIAAPALAALLTRRGTS